MEMTRNPDEHSQPKQFVPRRGDRRQVNALKGVPLIGGLGLVFNDRRSHRERRRIRQETYQPPPCALLQRKEQDRPAPGLLGNISSGWDRTRLGAWIQRCLKTPWRRKR